MPGTGSFVQRLKERNKGGGVGRLKPAASVADHKFLYDSNQLNYLCQSWEQPKVVLARLAEVGGVQGLEYALHTNLEEGIGKEEDERADNRTAEEIEEGVPNPKFRERIAAYGQNKFTKQPMKAFCVMVLETLNDPFLIVLIVAAVISIAIGIYEYVECPQNVPGFIDGLAILIAVAIVTLVGAWNDYSQEKQFRAVEDEAAKKVCVVTRGRNDKGEGKNIEVPYEDVVVGDIVLLKMGSQLPADGVLINATDDFKVTEAALTGEAIEVKKNFLNPLCLSGTQAVSGEGTMIVTAVGDDTVWGGILSRIQEEREDTPLQEKLDKMAKQIGYGGMAIAAVLFLAVVIKFLATGTAEERKNWFSKVTEALILAVTIIVVAVPEGLPLAVTISLAYSMKRMMTDQNFVRHLAACETMGNATTICSDKTGTLTLNKMRVEKCSIGGTFFEKAGPTDHVSKDTINELCDGLCINSNAFEQLPTDDKERAAREKYGPVFTGANSTEYALLFWANQDFGHDYLQARKKYEIAKGYPFSSRVKRSSVLVDLKNGSFRMYLKGAAEQVLNASNGIQRTDGTKNEMSKEDREEVLKHMDHMASTGLRCLGVAYRDYTEDEIERTDSGGVQGIKLLTKTETRFSRDISGSLLPVSRIPYDLKYQRPLPTPRAPVSSSVWLLEII